MADFGVLQTFGMPFEYNIASYTLHLIGLYSVRYGKIVLTLNWSRKEENLWEIANRLLKALQQRLLRSYAMVDTVTQQKVSLPVLLLKPKQQARKSNFSHQDSIAPD